MGDHVFFGYFFAGQKDWQTAKISIHYKFYVSGVWGTVRKTDWVVENNSHSFDICTFVSVFLSDILLAELFLLYTELLSDICNGLFDFYSFRREDVLSIVKGYS